MEDGSNEVETSIVKAEAVSLDEDQMSEQLYASAGLDPVVEAGLRDYDESIRRENKLIKKVLGPSESDIKGYGEAVAKRVAFAVYGLLNRQYGGKVGEMRAYIMSLEDEKNRANNRYDELMGRVIGILGDEYKQLRMDSNNFMEKLNTTLGEDIKASKIDQNALVASLADIDGLRGQIADLEKRNRDLVEKHQQETSSLKEKHQQETGSLKEKQEAALASQKAEHKDEIKELKAEMKEERTKWEAEAKELTARIAALEAEVKKLEADKAGLTGELTAVIASHGSLKDSVAELPAAVPSEEIGAETGEETYAHILKDSKVPDAVIKGVGQFIDFKKYLSLAAAKGAEKATERAKQLLSSE